MPPAELDRLRPVASPLDGGDRKHRSDPAPDQLEPGREPLLVARQHDDDIGVPRRARFARWPDEEHETGHEPGRDEGGEDEQQTAQHGPTVLSPPVTGVLFNVRRTARRHRHRVQARGGANARRRRQPVGAPRSNHADAHAFVPRVDDPDYVATLRTLVKEHAISLVVPLTDLDHGVLSRAKDELGAVVLLPRPEVVDALADKWLAHLLFVEHGIGSPDTWLPADVPADVAFPVLVKARRGFGSRGIYAALTAASSSSSSASRRRTRWCRRRAAARSSPSDLFCDLESRCLNAVPRTMIESKGGESIKGMTIADPELIEVGPLRLGDGRARRARERAVLPRAGRHTSRSRTSNPRFGGAFPLRPRPAAAFRSSRSRSPRASGPSRGSATSAAGLYMTRFFSELVLSAGPDGTLETVRGRVARAARRALAVLCVVGFAAACGGRATRIATSDRHRLCVATACRPARAWPGSARRHRRRRRPKHPRDHRRGDHVGPGARARTRPASPRSRFLGARRCT